MESKSVQVVARITAKPGKEEVVAAILRGLVGPTRRENGCVSYQLFRNNSDASDFVFIEEWTSDAALDAHLKTPHLLDAVAKVTPLVAKATDISRYSLVE
jgi:quinol monooxygenase YgiN